MSIFTTLQEWIGTALDKGAGKAGAFLDVVFAAIGEMRDPVRKRQAAFSVAMIALSAKMAKADGVVTRDEIEAFHEIFEIPQEELKNVSRLFNLAKQDIAGFEAYAKKIKTLFEGNRLILEDVLDGLFHIAKADNILHERELLYLENIAAIFELSDRQYEIIKHRHLLAGNDNPYSILGAKPDEPLSELKKVYRAKVAELHPDKMIARGVPPEFVAIANNRLAEVNVAWAKIQAQHEKVRA